MEPDTNMGDSIDRLSRESNPPVPPRHSSMGLSRDVKSVSVQASISRSSSPEKSIRKSSIPTNTGALRYEWERSTDNRIFPDAKDWQAQFLNEKELWEQREAELRSKIDGLEDRNRNASSSEAFQELQNALAVERGLKEQAQDELQQRSMEAEETRKRWKQAARELDKFRSQSQGFYQVTDNYLIELTNQLRYNIRSFAIQYFGGEVPSAVQIERTDYWKMYMEFTTRAARGHEAYLLSQKKCHSIIQAFLWRFLVDQVFDKFRWAGGAGKPLRGLCKFVRPEWQDDMDSDHEKNPEVERKFQIWSATTTGFVFDSIDMKEGSEAYKFGQSQKEYLISRVCETIDPFMRSRESGHSQDLLRIMDNALALDSEICRQVARVEWVFPSKKLDIMYDPAAMELEKGEKPSKANQKVLLAVSPAMKKRGKSTGEDFKVENILVPMEVSCEPVIDSKPRGSRWPW